MTRLTITLAARSDIAAVLRSTRDRFGHAQVHLYRAHIERCLDLVASDPLRPGSWSRPHLGAGVRAIHLDRAAGRIGATAHIVYYALDGGDGPDRTVVVLRLLHEAMDPNRHLPP